MLSPEVPYTNTAAHKSHAAPSSCGPSVYNFLHTSLLAHKILKWVLDFCKNFVLVSQSWGGPLAADHHAVAPQANGEE
jgi:hypothetical protein